MLLQEFARPYQGRLYDKRIDGIAWIEGRSKNFSRADNIEKFYFAEPGQIWSDTLGSTATNFQTLIWPLAWAALAYSGDQTPWNIWTVIRAGSASTVSRSIKTAR